MAKRIFDCFTFFNELEVLSLRLEELYEYVDYFVICESPVTFQGRAKPLVFTENQSKFKRFMSKVIHVVADDMPQTADPWIREAHQRAALARGVKDAGPSDIVIISDLDEIIKPSAVTELRMKSGYFMFKMNMYQFHLNTLASRSWNKVFAFDWSLRDQLPDFSQIRLRPLAAFEAISGGKHEIEDGGWHFTFLGGPNSVRQKLSSYSHTGSFYEKMLEPGGAEKQLITGYSVGGVNLLELQEIDASFPKTIRQNLEYYRNIHFIKDTMTRLRELEKLYKDSEFLRRSSDNKTREIMGRAAAFFELGHQTVADYAHPSFAAEVTRIENLIPSSATFTIGWHGGTQAVSPVLSDQIPHFMYGNAVLRHERTCPEEHKDNNVGAYSSKRSLLAETLYTASCWIWIPTDFRGSAAFLSVEGGVQNPRKGYGNLEVRDRWQRVSTNVFCPPTHTTPRVVLRLDGGGGVFIYSTCWQLEVGKLPTDYLPTGAHF